MSHLMLVAIATVVAAPLAYYFSARWLGTFAYHADLSVYPFVIAGVTSIALAFATVAYQAARLMRDRAAQALAQRGSHGAGRRHQARIRLSPQRTPHADRGRLDRHRRGRGG